MEDRKLYIIADDIVRDWGTKINYAAKPYLIAMQDMGDINEHYGFDTGRSVVAYFLANAQTWRGETARRVKKELKGMLG